MGALVILGCGYAGKVLARRLIARGGPVRATTTTESKLKNLSALGAEPVALDLGRPETFSRAMQGARAVFHLSPPEHDIGEEVRLISAACGPELETYVYASTTGAFGSHGDPEMWIDESTPPRNLSPRGQQRLDYEHALEQAGLPLRIVRVAGIYGPGRTLRDSIERSALVLFDGGPPTSRIHVEDLAALLEAMMASGAPRLAIACDDEPAPTLDVARYTCELLGLPVPEPVPFEDAKRMLSPEALEMRIGGRRCRSLVREKLMGPLAYPTYREGVLASLEAEGALAPNIDILDPI